MTPRLPGILCTLSGVLFAADAAPAQTSATPPGALAVGTDGDRVPNHRRWRGALLPIPIADMR
jgi:hypothetical protein